MPRKLKVIVELDVHTVTCPGTFLRDYGYLYLKVNCMGLEVNTKSVAPTFPLFFHERLRFERIFKNCQDPAYASIMLKGEDILVELRQHDDYINEGYCIGHYANNCRDFLFPAVPPYPGTGREVNLFKTSLFNPIRITGQPIKLEFSTKTTVKEVPELDDYSDDYELDGLITNLNSSTASRTRTPTRSLSQSRSRSLSPNRKSIPRADETRASHEQHFLVRRKDEKLLENRNFSSFTRPKVRRSRSKSPTRRPRSTSPTRSPTKSLGTSMVESLPAWKYSMDFPSSGTRGRHIRSATEPGRTTFRSSSPSRSLRYALDDLNVTEPKTFTDPLLKYRSRHSPNLRAALRASDRIQNRVEKVVNKSFDGDLSDVSDDSLDLLRSSLREERKALSDAIREADRAAYYRSLGLDL